MLYFFHTQPPPSTQTTAQMEQELYLNSITLLGRTLQEFIWMEPRELEASAVALFPNKATGEMRVLQFQESGDSPGWKPQT